MDITHYLQKIEKKVEVIYPQTLFGLDFKVVWKDHRCPLCFNKLRELDRIWICQGKKHAKAFIIKKKRMGEILA